MENAVSVDITRQLIENHLQVWRQRLEDFRIAMAVAEAIDEPDPRKDQIRQESTRCIKAIEKLMAMQTELPKNA